MISRASPLPNAGSGIAGYLMVASAASSWGLWPYFLRRAESYGPIPSELEAAVALAMLTLVSGSFVFRDRIAKPASRRAWAGVVWLGISDALNVILFFRAIQLTTVAIAVLTHYLTPVLVALAAPMALGEKVTRRTFGAVALALLGLVLLLGPWRDPGQAAAPAAFAGAAFGAASAIFYASNVIFNKRLAPSFSGSELACFHGLVATPLVCALVPLEAWARVDLRAWGWLLSASLGPGALAGLVFVWGLRRIPAAHASALTLLEPFVAVLVGIVAFAEVPAPLGLFGGVLVVIGAALVVVRPTKAAA